MQPQSHGNFNHMLNGLFDTPSGSGGDGEVHNRKTDPGLPARGESLTYGGKLDQNGELVQ